jgi:hypothetical protein
MLSCTSEDAQVHMNTGIKNKLLPRFFWTVQDALVCLKQALTNPYVLQEARNQFRALCMGSSEAFAQFWTRFLLLAHESYLCLKDYCEELWDKITLALGTAIAVIEYQLVTYD